MTKFLASLHLRLMDVQNREEGQTFAEYGLIIALIAILLVAALGLFRGALVTTFTNISNAL
jgi:Flp pilus assembly pilin Flp